MSAITTRIGRISDSRRTGQQVGHFTETRRPAPSLCGGSVDSRATFLTTELFRFYHGRDREPGTARAMRQLSSLALSDPSVQQALQREGKATFVQNLIFQMVAQNPSWGAPRIHHPSRASSARLGSSPWR